MNGFHGSGGTIVTVNTQLLAACLSAIIAWSIWPDTPEWWGLGLLSILLWLAAASGLGNAVRAALAHYQKEKTIAEYMALGGAPKSARLATLDDLRKAGMVE
ncbi:MAG: hypothetical protein WDZ83_20510 [Rhizobiaceae bacterium]